MLRTGTLLSIVVLALGCASASQRPPQLLQPQVEIRQTGGAGDSGVTRNLRGGMPIRLQIAVTNPSAEKIEVESIELSSLGMGGLDIPNTKRPVNKSIAPDGFEVIDFWTAAYGGDSVAGNGGPITVRLTVYFKSEFGKFREIYTQNINTAGSPRVDPQ